MVPIILLGSFPLPKGTKCSKEGRILHIFPLLWWGQVVVSYKGRRKQCLVFGQTIRVLGLADIDPCLSFVWYDGTSLVEALPCSTQGSDQCHSQHCGRFWWQGNSSNASVLLRWGLAGASVWTLGVSKTLCGVVWYQRMCWWCKAHDKSKVAAVTDHSHCKYLLQSDWDSWAMLHCHYLHSTLLIPKNNMQRFCFTIGGFLLRAKSL